MNLRWEIIRNIIEAPPTDEDILSLLEDIMEDHNKGKRLLEFLKDLAKRWKRQALRFWEVCYREDDLERWAEFLKNESIKETAVWKEDIIEEFSKKLREWWQDDNPTRWANRKLKGKLDDLATRPGLTHLAKAEQIVGKLEPTFDELKQWRRSILRKTLGYLLRGER
ncbi:MAG: hypothetical protein J7K33_10635 [Candidatus Marinimicrobia bacterium]|nr:hypothetical protein [Candidatus Neomarinimicrobiota bacterium]